MVASRKDASAGSSASCTDGVKNNAETGVDCGGGTCVACSARFFDHIQETFSAGTWCPHESAPLVSSIERFSF